MEKEIDKTRSLLVDFIRFVEGRTLGNVSLEGLDPDTIINEFLKERRT